MDRITWIEIFYDELWSLRITSWIVFIIIAGIFTKSIQLIRESIANVAPITSIVWREEECIEWEYILYRFSKQIFKTERS